MEAQQVLTTVHGLVIHGIEKGRGTRNAPALQLGKSVLPLDDKSVDFSVAIDGQLRSARTRDYGDFRTGAIRSEFSRRLETYLDTPTVGLFYELSTAAAEAFQHEISLAAGAIGGYLTFIHHSLNDEDFFDVLLLNDTESLAVSANLHLESVEHLDLSNFAFAARVYLVRLEEGLEDHIGYIRGTRGEPSQYFQEFIGADLTGAKEESEAIRQAIMEFTSDMEFEEMTDRRQQAEDYLLSLYSRNSPGSIDVVAQFVAPENPEGFVEFALGPDFQASETFGVHKSTIQKLTSIHVTSEGITLRVERNRLTNVVVEGNSVIIRDAPTRVLEEVRKHAP